MSNKRILFQGCSQGVAARVDAYLYRSIQSESKHDGRTPTEIFCEFLGDLTQALANNGALTATQIKDMTLPMHLRGFEDAQFDT